ncbi:MAG: recombination mediator RecR [Patescibacteria group bacterium]
MDSIEKLKNIFRNFPTVGPRTAGRFVYYLIKLPQDRIDELTSAISELKNKIKLCRLCFQPFEALAEESLCQICSNPSRNKKLLCIVEKETDLLSIENTKKYNGLYFILGGTVSVMRKEDIGQLRVEELKKRLRQPFDAAQGENKFSEIIVALNPTPEGKATSILIEREIKEIWQVTKTEGPEPQRRITHLARGIPVGGELEYADEETLKSAFEGRK